MASTFDAATIVNGNMPLMPGDQAGVNYSRALFYGGALAREPVGMMMVNSFIMAMGIAIGKILISILSAYRGGLFQASRSARRRSGSSSSR